MAPKAAPDTAPVDRAGFGARTGLPPEILAKLDIYAAELRRWGKAINLVAAASLADLWSRHFLDSWQLTGLAGADAGDWIDLGSGGGFPGLVIAACRTQPVSLIESDRRKAVFLRETARRMGVQVAVTAARIESLPPPPRPVAVISARALAPLPRLLALAAPLAGPETLFLFPKGQNVGIELTAATECWKFEHEAHRSLSDPEGVVLSIRKLARHA